MYCEAIYGGLPASLLQLQECHMAPGIEVWVREDCGFRFAWRPATVIHSFQCTYLKVLPLPIVSFPADDHWFTKMTAAHIQTLKHERQNVFLSFIVSQSSLLGSFDVHTIGAITLYNPR